MIGPQVNNKAKCASKMLLHTHTTQLQMMWTETGKPEMEADQASVNPFSKSQSSN